MKRALFIAWLAGCSSPPAVCHAGERQPCAATSDCTTALETQCCGLDHVYGVARSAACSFPVTDCRNVECAKFLGAGADDGNVATFAGAIGVACVMGSCRSFVTDGGG